jgi:nucleotide-binding universal stress UspA family protein
MYLHSRDLLIGFIPHFNKTNSMKKILVTTDFSAVATNAVYYAADMAMAMNADLMLLHVVQTPIGYSDLPIALNLEDMMRTAENDMLNLKQETIQRTKGKINIETEVAMGGFYGELENICERIKPYVVVMGSQGKTETEHVLFGSHATDAVKHLMWPVITVPPGVAFSELKKIGLASDLTNVVEATPIEEISMLVKDFNAELHILNTGKTAVFDADIVFESGLLQEMTMSLNPKFHFINNNNIDEGIMDFAEKNQIDLLIVLPGRHSLLSSIFHKSHTKQLVLHSHIPVMSLHK